MDKFLKRESDIKDIYGLIERVQQLQASIGESHGYIEYYKREIPSYENLDSRELGMQLTKTTTSFHFDEIEKEAGDKIKNIIIEEYKKKLATYIEFNANCKKELESLKEEAFNPSAKPDYNSKYKEIEKQYT